MLHARFTNEMRVDDSEIVVLLDGPLHEERDGAFRRSESPVRIDVSRFGEVLHDEG